MIRKKKKDPFITTAQKSMLSVVQLHVEGIEDLTNEQVLNPEFLNSSFWTGSGFFIEIDGKEGYVLTNAHVAKNSLRMKFKTMVTGNESFDIELVGVINSLNPDIALLKMSPNEIIRFKKYFNPLPHLILGSNIQISRGVEIKAIGYPLGMEEPNISGGEITNFISGDSEIAERLVTDAAINPGNSGGPSININGDVIGINTAIILGANNVGFITPIDFIKILLKNLIENKNPNLSDLGATFQQNSKAFCYVINKNTIDGVIIKRVYRGGTLYNAGLQQHDVLMAVNDTPIDRHGLVKDIKMHHHKSLFDVIRLTPIGEPIYLTYFREGTVQKVKGIAAPSPLLELKSLVNIYDIQFLNLFGLLIQPLNYSILEALGDTSPLSYEKLKQVFQGDISQKLIITHIDLGSEAQDQGFEIGDTIFKVCGKIVTSLDELESVINQHLEQIISLETESGAIGYFYSLNKFHIQRPIEQHKKL